MSHRFTELVDAALCYGAVLVASDREEPERGWVYLRVIDKNETLQVSLGPVAARELAAMLSRHADRVQQKTKA